MSGKEKLMEFARHGPFRASDAVARGIPRSYLRRWMDAGLIERISHGLYRPVDSDLTEMATVVEVARKAPSVVICLLTALQYHGLTTELPHAVWIMVQGPRRAPKIDFVKTEVVRASGPAFTFGVEEVVLEGVRVKITDPAKTVADCFRYRSHVGMEVAYAALQDYVRHSHERSGPNYTIPHLVDAARADRIYNLIRPSLEALV